MRLVIRWGSADLGVPSPRPVAGAPSLSTMSGVEGLGRVVPPTGGGAPSWAGELAGSLDHLGLQVTPQNVLEVAEVLLKEAERLWKDGDVFGFDAVVTECGGDPVSKDAAREFTPRLQALVAQGLVVADMLDAAGRRLAASAGDYGRTDTEIGALLGRYAGDRP